MVHTFNIDTENKGAANNGAANKGAANKGAADKGAANKGAANKGAANNGTAAITQVAARPATSADPMPQRGLLASNRFHVLADEESN